jgi:vanillate/3-O-methylgallate O-demethylase
VFRHGIDEPRDRDQARGVAGGAAAAVARPPVRLSGRPEFTNWRSEQQAWRSSCVLFDQSHHMTDFFLRGPGALELLSRFGVNSFAGFTPGKAKQYVAASSDGYFIGDAICFHLDDELFDVVGYATVINWLQYNAETGGYDVTFERDEDSARRPSGPPALYRYELQGPTAGPLTAKLTGAPLPDVKFFHMTEFSIAGHRVRALRHGMAGRDSGQTGRRAPQGQDNGSPRTLPRAFRSAIFETTFSAPAPRPGMALGHVPVSANHLAV